MKKIHYLLTAASLVLGGCATGGNVDDVNLMRKTNAQGGTPFTQALAVDYRNRANHEADVENEWNDAGWFARKGLRAAKGEVVLPSDVGVGGGDINRWGDLGPVIYVRRALAPELEGAHGRLMVFLDGGGRVRLPAIAARAQGAFDCWLEEAWEPDDFSQCRDEFLKLETQFTVASVAAATPAPSSSVARIANTFQVFFDFDRSNVSEEAAQIIEKAAANAKQGKLTRIELTGHTDSSGPDAYNQALSERRAAAVKQILLKDGIPAIEITSIGVGKGGQLVSTADGVREPQNRRTEIIMH
ncbi:OmpA family protein [Telmatospirillum sp.]|uniref:OmpA family protein n=1 Tax=Telmatospirillum sp. TaxID=2079197 RepID=UPI00283AE65F|nr:OmpA family protein [Telmatospirillum sp.]MDR3441038.1 OmpA family protein [Telmatospirillum sp.]